MKAPIEKTCNKNSFSKCSVDKEVSSLMEDEKIEVVAELASKGLKKERIWGRRLIIGILSFVLTVLCSFSLFIIVKSDLKRNIELPEKENQTFIDARKYIIFFEEENTNHRIEIDKILEFILFVLIFTDDYLIYIGGYPNRGLNRTVEFNSIKNNKTCYIQPLDYEEYCLASAVTQIGVITCGGSHNGWRKACVRLTNRNTWETFPSMNKAHFYFDMIAMGDVLVAFHKSGDTYEMINLRNGGNGKSSRWTESLIVPVLQNGMMKIL